MRCVLGLSLVRNAQSSNSPLPEAKKNMKLGISHHLVRASVVGGGTLKWGTKADSFIFIKLQVILPFIAGYCGSLIVKPLPSTILNIIHKVEPHN